MKKNLLILLMLPTLFYAQSDEVLLKKGNDALSKLKYDDAYSFYIIAANRENETAALQIGKMIYTGLLSGIDYSEAFTIFKKLELKGNVKGISYLGFMYYYGFGVEKSIDKALEKFRIGEKSEDPVSLYMLGTLHYYGMNVPRSMDIAKVYFERAIAKGDMKSYTWLASLQEYTLKDMVAAVRILREGCDKNDSHSCSGLAEHYQSGKGVSGKDIHVAVMLYKKAIEIDGNNYAKFYLSLIYADKNNSYYNLMESEKLYKEIIDSAIGFELYNFGKVYTENVYTPVNNAKAISLMEQAIKKNEPKACIFMGSAYSNGSFGLMKNEAQARQMYEKAGALGMVGHANYELGRLEYNNNNRANAKAYFTKSCNAGFKEGCDALNRF